MIIIKHHCLFLLILSDRQTEHSEGQMKTDVHEMVLCYFGKEMKVKSFSVVRTNYYVIS